MSSDLVKLRKYVSILEETHHDGGPALAQPVLKAVVGGVVANPYAGRHVEDIQPMMKALEPLAVDLTERVMKLLDARGSELEAYGKGVIVGVAGELEHAALWHQPSGFGIRHAIHQDKSASAKSIVPSTVKVASAGARIDIPLHHVMAAYVRSHFDTIEFCVPDGPRPDEIVFIVAAAIGGRPHARVGGLTVDGITAGDGQR
jgi:Amino acid synthesis